MGCCARALNNHLLWKGHREETLRMLIRNIVVLTDSWQQKLSNLIVGGITSNECLASGNDQPWTICKTLNYLRVRGWCCKASLKKLNITSDLCVRWTTKHGASYEMQLCSTVRHRRPGWSKCSRAWILVIHVVLVWDGCPLVQRLFPVKVTFELE